MLIIMRSLSVSSRSIYNHGQVLYWSTQLSNIFTWDIHGTIESSLYSMTQYTCMQHDHNFKENSLVDLCPAVLVQLSRQPHKISGVCPAQQSSLLTYQLNAKSTCGSCIGCMQLHHSPRAQLHFDILHCRSIYVDYWRMAVLLVLYDQDIAHPYVELCSVYNLKITCESGGTPRGAAIAIRFLLRHSQIYKCAGTFINILLIGKCRKTSINHRKYS